MQPRPDGLGGGAACTPTSYEEVVVVTVTINKMSASKGCEYLLRTVAAGDGDRSLSTPLTRYYTEAGTPPGRWLGSGVASLESVSSPATR